MVGRRQSLQPSLMSVSPASNRDHGLWDSLHHVIEAHLSEGQTRVLCTVSASTADNSGASSAG